MKLFLTCEHAESEIPLNCRNYFTDIRSIERHRIFDLGALHTAQTLSDTFKSVLTAGKVSRLITDLNRTPGHPGCISPYLKEASPEFKKNILRKYHTTHWKKVTEFVRKNSRNDTVLHIAVHSFTPVWKGKKRPTDIGILYDPRRNAEKQIAIRWKAVLSQSHPDLTVHLNRPYRGWTDSITRSLRLLFGEKKYIGFELEMNQKFCGKNGNKMNRRINDAVLSSVQSVISGL
ncbi:MAG: N-formylglutamate amidohydrolase [Candidatus Omnitrophica bacterium]|nr:N-formylglutamate amidohydrolase [Candidatus Omnitrophota bacterium]